MPASALNPSGRTRGARPVVAVAAVMASVFTIAGCAGGRVSVTAVRARYPVSLSPVIRDATGRLYDQRSLRKLGTLIARRTSLGFAYSAFTLRSNFDISQEINTQVSAVSGEAVVDLSVSVSNNCASINGFPFLTALPLWPGCVPVVVTGTIVRRGDAHDVGPPPN